MDTMGILWSVDGTPVTEYGVDVPRWIEQDITPADVAAILQGGCESGAYMPAVTYRDALATMNEHGDEVLDFLESALGEPPELPERISWAGIAVHYLSCAVELWAAEEAGDLAEAIREADEDE